MKTTLFREHLFDDIRLKDVEIDILIRNIKSFTFKGGLR